MLHNGLRLADSVPSLATHFEAAGYHTGAVLAAAFLREVTPGFGYVKASDHWRPGARIVDDAIEWLRGRGASRYFLWMHLYDVHSWKRQNRTDPALLARVREQTDVPRADFQRRLSALHGIPEVSPQLATAIDHYDARIAYVDAQIERLLEHAKDFAPDARHLWIITSDHGEGLGSHGYDGHVDNIFEEQLRIPLIVHGAAVASPPRRSPALVSTVDLLPTLLDALGRSPDGGPQLSGRSLWPLIQGGADALPERLAFSERAPGRFQQRKGEWHAVAALIQDDHKYLYREGEEDAFYDLGADPKELTPLATGTPDAEALRSLLIRHLEAFRREGQTPVGEISEALEAELRALGYAD